MRTFATRAGIRTILTLVSIGLLLPLSQLAPAQTLLWEAEGQAEDDTFGRAIARIDDLDGDGCADLIVGAPQSIQFADQTGPGYVVVLSGATGEEILRLTGQALGDRFGFSVADAGDVTGDGKADFLVGATGGDYVKVFSGADGSLIRTVTGPAGARFGFDVANVGDLGTPGDSTPDGYEDFIVGAVYGGAYVYSGADGDLMFELFGTNGGNFGSHVDGMGDTDGDGVPDLLVGATNSTDAEQSFEGQVFVFSGRDGTLLQEIRAGLWGYNFNHGSAAVDLDGDGTADILIGTGGQATGGGGSARVYSGSDGTLLHNIPGNTPGGRFGEAVADAGDVDGDGTRDLFIGAPLFEVNGKDNAGAAQVFSGTSGGLLFGFEGTIEGQLGHSLAELGDLNGDELSDLAISSPFTNTPGPNVTENIGRVQVFLSPQPPIPADPVLSTISASPASVDFLGISTITVIPVDSAGQNLGVGQQVFPTTTEGRLIGPVVEQGNGTYTQLLEADVTSNLSVVSAYANGTLLANPATVTPVPTDLAHADGEIPVKGEMAGGTTFLDTQNEDFASQTIREVLSGGRKKGTSLLEHKWTIPVPAGALQAVFFLKASRTVGTSDVDDYEFAYSASENGAYTPLVTISNTMVTDPYVTVPLSPVPSGPLFVRVVDTDRTPGETSLGWVLIDHMGIATISGPPVPGITVNPTSGLVTTESGGSDSFSVVLNTQPTADVTIGISSSDTSEGTVSASIMTFATTDWSTPQTVTVTGVDDASFDGDAPYTILTAAAASIDLDYDGLNAADVSVTNQDDEVPPPIMVDSFMPDTSVTAGSIDVPFSVFGAGFQAGAIVSFENGSGPVPQVTDFMFVSDTHLAGMLAVAANGPKTRVWDVRVTNPDSSTDVLAGALTVVK